MTVLSNRLGLIIVIVALLAATIAPTTTPHSTRAATDLIVGADAQVVDAQGDRVNIRSLPSATGELITSVPEGWLVTIVDGPFTDESGGSVWYQVIGNGQTGFMLADYLQNLGDTSVYPASSMLSTARVNLRSGPGTGNPVLVVIPNGATVETTGAYQNGFARLVYDGTTGWAASQYFQSAAPIEFAITTANVNLRSGPATSWPVQRVIPKGSTVSITGPLQSGFYPVEFEGVRGFASANYLQETEPQPRATTTANVNLRSGPGTSYSVLSVIPNRSTVVVTGGSENGFYPVVTGGLAGYASANYLDFGTTPPPPAVIPGWTTANLNLRAGPSTTASVLVVIPNNSQISITGALVDGFYPVRYDGIEGYASAGWISTVAPTPTPPPTPTPTPAPVTRTGWTTANVNLRTAATTASGVLLVIPNGSQITITGEPVDGFYPVRYAESNGYASASYITFELAGIEPIIWPVSGGAWHVLQGYNGSSHQNDSSAWQYLYALDIARQDGQTAGIRAYAPVSGKVAWYERASGGITIDMGNGYAFAMFHLTVERHWQPGDTITQGDFIGTVSPPGGEGFQQVPHIHLTLWQTNDGGNWDRHALPFTGQFALGGIELPSNGSAYQWSGFQFYP